jgi:hypothetical protein
MFQIEFLRDRARAQLGQKADSTDATLVSISSNTTIPFGALVVHDETDAFLCKLPTAKPQLEKPIGIALRQFYCQEYEAKNSIPVMRKGRVWVNADKVTSPGDAVFIRFEEGLAKFTGDKKDNTQLKGAIFLEKSEGGLVPIEVNFVGGVQ